MKLWLISQNSNDDYDTYDAAVVAAESDEEARHMNPRNGERMDWTDAASNQYGSWCSTPDAVLVCLIGEATPGTEAGVVLASFNAG